MHQVRLWFYNSFPHHYLKMYHTDLNRFRFVIVLFA